MFHLEEGFADGLGDVPHCGADLKVVVEALLEVLPGVVDLVEFVLGHCVVRCLDYEQKTLLQNKVQCMGRFVCTSPPDAIISSAKFFKFCSLFAIIATA